MNRFIGIFLIFFLVAGAYAQNTRSAEAPKPPRPLYKSAKKEKKGLFASKKSSKKTGKSEVVEFRKRLQKVYKKKAKEEYKMDKPRYKDPTYFGHKKPPKKRKVGKQKFCKVCKIKH